jgi:CHAT domain-containing protein/tetratricopeptide (TPR) repeat protein
MSSLVRCLALLFLYCLPICSVQAQCWDEIDELRRQLDPLQQSDQYNEALPLVEKLSEVVRRCSGENSGEYAATLALQGGVLRALGRYEDAEASFTSALRIATAALGPEDPDVTFVLNHLALLYKAQGRYRDAEAHYQKALAIREKALGRDHLAVEQIVSNLAALYVTQGRYGEAERFFTRANDIIEKTLTEKALRPDDAVVGRHLNNHANLYWKLGRFSDAEPLFKRVLAIVEGSQGSEHPAVASALNNLASVYLDQGRYVEAEPLFKRALSIREKAQGLEHPDVGEAAHNLAWFYQGWGRLTQDQGRYAKAEPLYRRGLDIAEKALGPGHATVGSMSNDLAVLNYDLGRYAEDRGRFAEAQGHYAKSEPLFKQAIEVRKGALGAEHSDIGQSMYRLARLYHAQKRFAEAGPLHQQALEIRRKALGPEHPDVVESLDGIAEMYEAQGNWMLANDAVRHARDIVISRVQHGTSASNGATSESGRREIAQGRAVFLRLVRTLWAMRQQQPARGSELLNESYLGAYWAEQTEASVALAQTSIRLAKGKGPLSDLVRESQDLARQGQTLDKQLYASIAQTAGRNLGAERQLRHQLAEIDARRVEIDQTFERDFPDYSALSGPEPVSVEETKGLLQPDEALVQFTVDDNETFVWAIARDGERWARSGLGFKALREDVAALRCGLDYRGSWTADENWQHCFRLLNVAYTEGKPLPFDLARAHALYKAMFGTIEDLIKGKQLLIVASGPLSSLPFHVLVTKRPQRAIPLDPAAYRSAAWLGLSNSIGVLPSAASLKALRQHGKVRRASKLYLGVGNPLLDGPQDDPSSGDYYKTKAGEARANQSCANLGAPQRVASARGGLAPAGFSSVILGARADNAALRRWAPLPDTANEVCAVASKLGTAQSMVLLGSQATEARLKELSEKRQLADFSILHFATHGALYGQVLAEPGLILTPPPATDDPKALEIDDGYLSASEIATLALDADWVVLSACNTAGSSGETSEALSGLARAFFYAGTRALLVSHWEVDSDAAVELTTRAFAKMAARQSVGRAEALRVAMRELSGEGKPANAHPSHWAPFVVVGESGR